MPATSGSQAASIPASGPMLPISSKTTVPAIHVGVCGRYCHGRVWVA